MQSDLSFLTSPSWWQQSIGSARSFARFCILPASLVAGGHILLLSLSLRWPGVVPQQNLQDSLTFLMAILIGVLIASILGLALSLWGLTLWLRTLTAFAHASMTNTTATVPDEATFRQSLAWVKTREGHISKVWVFGSAFVVLPLLPAVLLLSLKVLASPEFAKLGVQVPQLPQWAYLSTSFVSSLISFAYLFTLLVFSVISEYAPGKTAILSLTRACQTAPSVLAVTALVLFVNCLIGTPHALLFWTPIPDMVLNNFLPMVCAQIWLAATSCILWPFSVLPYCRLQGAPAK